jgi:hypothetical protein
LATISVHSQRATFSDINRLSDPSTVLIVIMVQNGRTISINHMILLHYMVSDGRLMPDVFCSSALTTGEVLIRYFFNLRSMFIQAGTKISSTFTNIHRRTVCTGDIVYYTSIIQDVALVFGVNKDISQSLDRF